ncbi:hypothetical protein BHM03_00014768 [Ensete ventricosum]|nr:hypothetical protein BHM03_00014768 [Ensete ventricosum]
MVRVRLTRCSVDSTSDVVVATGWHGSDSSLDIDVAARLAWVLIDWVGPLSVLSCTMHLLSFLEKMRRLTFDIKR